MQSHKNMRILFSQENSSPLMITRVKEKSLPLHDDFNYDVFLALFHKLKNSDNKEELFRYFEKMLENIRVTFNHNPRKFYEFILYSLDESTYGLLTDFGTEWLRQHEVFNNLSYFVTLLNKSSIKNWKPLLDCVGHDWLVSRLDYNSLYNVLYNLYDNRSGQKNNIENATTRNFAFLSYLGNENVRKLFTPENVGKYIANWRCGTYDQVYRVLLRFLNSGEQDVIDISSIIPKSWEERTKLIEIDEKQWLIIRPEENNEGWIQKSFLTGDAIGTTLHHLATPITYAINGYTVFVENHDPHVSGNLPKPREEVKKCWEDFIKYLKPNWQDTLFTTPGELKALFKDNENYEAELIYFLVNSKQQQHLNIFQSFELIEALSGKFLHAWLINHKTEEQFKTAIAKQNDKVFYKTYLYAVAKAALYEEQKSSNYMSLWCVPKAQRIYAANELVKAIVNDMPSAYHFGCNNGFTGIVRGYYMQMLKDRALKNSSENNGIPLTKCFQLV